MKIMFWNLFQKNNIGLINSILIENNIDIALFAEYAKTDFDQIDRRYCVIPSNGGCDKIKVISRKEISVIINRESTRYCVLSVLLGSTKYILAGAHLEDNLHGSREDRKNTIRYLVNDIVELENELQTTNTIVVGDFNCSPFDEEMIQKDSFNSVLFKDLIVHQEIVERAGQKYRRFYNPMLEITSECDKRYGTYYHNRGIKTLCWYMYDQVLVRKSLIDKLVDVDICQAVIGKSVLTKNGYPNKDISDHLSLLVEVNS